MRYYRPEQRYINTYTMSILLYLYDHDGETIGFRDMTANMKIGNSTLRKYMNELVHAKLVEEDFIGVTSRFRLTEKGKEIAKKLKSLLDELKEA